MRDNKFQNVVISGFIFKSEDVNFYDDYGCSPLYYTCKHKNLEFTCERSEKILINNKQYNFIPFLDFSVNCQKTILSRASIENKPLHALSCHTANSVHKTGKSVH